MKYLIDTHTLLWIVSDDKKLSKKAKSLYLDFSNEIYLSKASVWEISIKVSLGKLKLNSRLEDFISDHILNNNIKLVDIELTHIIAIESLPFYHRDPFDRLIISQAMCDKFQIISADEAFDDYPIKRLW